MGWDEDRFEVVPHRTFVCIICCEIFEDPVRLIMCGHNFCKECVGQLRRQVCPICNQTFSSNQIQPNRDMREQLNDMNLKCQFAPDCPMIIGMERLLSHEKNCEFNPDATVSCGCGTTVKRIELASHDCMFMKNKRLTEEHDVLKSRLETITKQLDDEKRAHLKNVDDLKKQLNELQNAKTRLDQEKSEFSDSSEVLKNQLNKSQNENRKLKEENRAVSIEVATLREQLGHVQEQNNTHCWKITELKKQLDYYHERLENFGNEEDLEIYANMDVVESSQEPQQRPQAEPQHYPQTEPQLQSYPQPHLQIETTSTSQPRMNKEEEPPKIPSRRTQPPMQQQVQQQNWQQVHQKAQQEAPQPVQSSTAPPRSEPQDKRGSVSSLVSLFNTKKTLIKFRPMSASQEPLDEECL